MHAFIESLPKEVRDCYRRTQIEQNQVLNALPDYKTFRLILVSMSDKRISLGITKSPRSASRNKKLKFDPEQILNCKMVQNKVIEANEDSEESLRQL